MIGDYPGRGVLVRRRPQGNLEWAYFVTGRSEASRHRRLHRAHDVVFVEPTEATEADPLRHYACARPFVDGLIVGNGDHVDVVARQLDLGLGLEAALVEIDPEPDPPINTPRIGAVLTDSFAAVFGVANRQGAIERKTTDVTGAPDIVAVHTTYDGPARTPVGSAPLHLLSSDLPFDRLVDALWSSLPTDLRVLLLAGTGTSVADCRTIHQ